MGFFDRFKRQEKAQRVIAVQDTGGASASWMDRNAKAFADEGYQRNGPTFRCVQILARSLASIEIVAKEDGELVENHPILDLLKRPNPTNGQSAFLEEYASYRFITGNAFVEALRDESKNRIPRELRIWSPFNMKVLVRTSTGLPIAYQWEFGNTKHTWWIDDITMQSDMLQWKSFNPFDPNMGMSPMQAAAFDIDQHNSSSEWNQALLQNGAKPDGMLVSKSKLTDDQYEKLKKEIETNYSGPSNAGRPMLGENDLEWQQLSLSPKDMDWLNGRKANAIDIAMVYGIPVQLLGIEGSQTFANFGQARLSLWEDQVIPYGDDLMDELNNWLVPMYDPDGKAKLELSFNYSGIEALKEKAAAALKDLEGVNFMTINEKRKAAGLDELDTEGANDVWLPSGLLPMGLDITTMANEDAAVKALVESGKSETHAREIYKKYIESK